jgi:predicted AAA+ superfamily ATPase
MIDRILYRHLSKKNAKNVLLLGARQVGKSTLVKSLKPVFSLNLADEGLFLSYSKDPARLKREVLALPNSGMVAIDEIQRVPKLLNIVQMLIDDDSPHRFVLTGSSARKLKRGGANLLPGRIVLEHLDPLMVEEIGSEFDLDRALQVGTLPGIYLDQETGADVLGTYATVYLREEIQAEALTREIGSYSRFLDAAAEASGQWVNYSKLSNDTEIPRETLRRFYSILEDTLVAFCLSPFRPKKPKRRVSQRDRYIFFDVGVRNAVLGIHRHPVSPTERGHIFEQWFILQCIYHAHSYRKPWQFFSYRTDDGAEVDLVIQTDTALIAVECKSRPQSSGIDLRGLRSFAGVAHLPLHKYVVYTGETRQKLNEDTVLVSYRDFLVRELKKF